MSKKRKRTLNRIRTGESQKVTTDDYRDNYDKVFKEKDKSGVST